MTRSLRFKRQEQQTSHHRMTPLKDAAEPQFSETMLRDCKTLLREQTAQENLIDTIACHIRQAPNLKVILQASVNEVQQWLGADRVVICRFAPTGGGVAVVEAGHPNLPPLLGWRINDTHAQRGCFLKSSGLEAYQAITDIMTSDLDSACIQLLAEFSVRSQLVIPIFVSQSRCFHSSPSPDALPAEESRSGATNPMWGMLIAHQCNWNRQWKRSEIALLQRLTLHLSLAIQQTELYQQVQDLNVELRSKVQRQTLQLQKALGCEAVMRRITDRIRDTLDERVILQTAVHELAIAFNLQSCHASFYNLDEQTSTVLYEQTYTQSALGLVIQLDQFPELYQPLLQGRSLQFCPLPMHPVQEQVAVLVCPIADQKGVLGDLWLQHSKDYVFGKQEVLLAQQVATQCAIAIRQARLYQAAQAQVEELEKLSRLKQDFLSTISHELRTPISNIKMSIQLLEMLLNCRTPEGRSASSARTSASMESTALQTKLNQCMKILQEECDREITLINDLLTLQQLEAGTQPFTPNPIYLDDWIAQVAETFQDSIAEHEQTLQMDIAPDLPPLVSDVFILNRVLVELLTNACKFTPNGGQIKVVVAGLPTSDATCTSIQLGVINTGIEIADDQVPLIFNPFYRIPSDDPWRYNGIGLGLALVKKMVAHLGGSIQVKSGSGQTIFAIELPVQRLQP